MPVQNFFNSHKKYAEESDCLSAHNGELILMIFKSVYRLLLVENEYSSRYINLHNSRAKIPDWRNLTDVIFPTFMEECFEKDVKPKIETMYSVSVSFDLWMSGGYDDIFDLTAHGIDKTFKRIHVHLRMLEYSSTKGVDLAAVLKPEVRRRNLFHKVTACDEDREGNLSTCMHPNRSWYQGLQSNGTRYVFWSDMLRSYSFEMPLISRWGVSVMLVSTISHDMRYGRNQQNIF